jgi:hypothetical protein
VVIEKYSQALPLLVEALRNVHGVMPRKPQDNVYTVAIGNLMIRLPGLFARLQAKIANVTYIAQNPLACLVPRAVAILLVAGAP